jgi:hypothetical protein
MPGRPMTKPESRCAGLDGLRGRADVPIILAIAKRPCEVVLVRVLLLLIHHTRRRNAPP